MTTTKETTCRKAFTLAEFAAMFGRHRSWAYRMARENRVKTICGYGTQLVPAHEVERILGEVGQSPTSPTEG